MHVLGRTTHQNNIVSEILQTAAGLGSLGLQIRTPRLAPAAMKLLLLGSTGDIGQYVVKRSLEGLPGATVTIFVRNKAKLEQLLDKNDLPKNAFKVF